MAQCCKTQHALSCREALQALIPAMLGAQGAEEEGDDSLLQGITRGTFQGIMQDRLSSHVMEVCTPLSLCALHGAGPGGRGGGGGGGGGGGRRPIEGYKGGKQSWPN